MQQQHSLATLGLIQVGGADHHRQLLRADQLIDDRPELAPRDGVDADGGLIEQQQFGYAHERAREAQLLLHAPRKPAGEPPQERSKTGHVQQLAAPRLAFRRRNVLNLRVEIQVLAYGEVFVETKSLRHVADAGPRLIRASGHIDAEHLDSTALQFQQSCRKPHERGLSRSIRTDEACYGAARRICRDLFEGGGGSTRADERVGNLLEPQCSWRLIRRGHAVLRMTVPWRGRRRLPRHDA
jgi:hypothetical protein